MAETTGSPFGANLRRLRRAKDLTQGELATAVGVHINTIIRAEAGEGDIRWSTAEKLAVVLGVSVAEFTLPIE